MQQPRLSIIIPARNEASTIGGCLHRVLPLWPGEAEVLVVDGGHDATADIVLDLARSAPGLRYVANPGDRGKGHAIRVGIAHARADAMAQIDADLQFAPEELPRLVEPLWEDRADVVLGSRFLAGHRVDASSWIRHAGNRCISAYASLLLRQPLSDVLAGVKAWTRRAIDKIDLRSDRFSYEVEIPVKAIRRGLRVLEVPVGFGPRTGGQSSVRVVRDGLAITRDLTRFWLDRRA